MAQTKRPNAGHILYMFTIKIFEIYPFYAPILKKNCITAYGDFKAA